MCLSDCLFNLFWLTPSLLFTVHRNVDTFLLNLYKQDVVVLVLH